MTKKNKRINYYRRFDTKSLLDFRKNNKSYKSTFFLLMMLIVLFLLGYVIINYQV